MDQETILVKNSTLAGTVRVFGAKNSALKLLAASILGQGETTLHNVPLISDIDIMCKTISCLGGKIKRRGHECIVDTSGVEDVEMPYELVSKMRASISVLGPMVARFGHARVAMPGGCQIGARKIDMHLIGLSVLGVKFEVDHGFIEATVPEGLHGGEILLQFASVGATENAMMTAVVAEGTTVIENAAREPEIVDLADMLNEMGCRVKGAGTSRIEIEGVPLESLHPCVHETVGDRIEAGTFLAGGALTGGPVRVEGINPEFLRMPIIKLKQMGCEISSGEDWIEVSRQGTLMATDIQTLPYPGFPTDLQAQFLLLCSVAEGRSIVTENVFENRFMFAEELKRMGVCIQIEGHHALVKGTNHLMGAPVKCTDLRGGAALVLAGIIASGETRLTDIYHIDRGYEDYVGKLQSLGADISRC